MNVGGGRWRRLVTRLVSCVQMVGVVVGLVLSMWVIRLLFRLRTSSRFVLGLRVSIVGVRKLWLCS